MSRAIDGDGPSYLVAASDERAWREERTMGDPSFWQQAYDQQQRNDLGKPFNQMAARMMIQTALAEDRWNTLRVVMKRGIPCAVGPCPDCGTTTDTHINCGAVST